MNGPLRMSTKYEDICVPCDVYQRATTVEKAFIDQMDRLTHPIDVSHSLSLAFQCLLSGLFYKANMAAGMEVIHGLSNTQFLSPILILLLSLPSA